jgi:hypothetical protein
LRDPSADATIGSLPAFSVLFRNDVPQKVYHVAPRLQIPAQNEKKSRP